MIAKNGGNLSGAVLARGVSAQGLDLSKVKVDKLMLSSLISANGNFRGMKLNNMDLRGVDFSGRDLRDADLSGADLSNADLRNAKLNNAIVNGATLRNVSLGGTNITGVKLGDAAEISINGDAGFPIFTSADMSPHLTKLTDRLTFVFTGKGKTHGATFDTTTSRKFKNSIYFPSIDHTLVDGNPQLARSAAQSLYLNGVLDTRYCIDQENTGPHLEKMSGLLFGEGFNENQKKLFHWARSALWCTKHIMTATETGDYSDLSKLTQFNKIYLQNERFGTTALPEVQQALFDLVVQHAPKDLGLTPEEIRQVEELFLSPNYRW